MKFKTTTLASAVSMLIAGTVAAQPGANDDAALRSEIAELRERLDELESRASVDDGGSGSRLDWSGQLRYRHETINDDASTERHRHRIRARLRLDADLSDDLTAGFRLSTGGGNPVSGNQTLDGGFTRKDIGFDRAFFSWDATENVTLTGGKMGNPMYRAGGNQLIFDNDLNPEGLALGYEGDRVFANLGGFWVEERSGTDDAILYALQGGYNGMIGNNAELTVGASYYNYQDTQGFVPFYLGDPQGNTLDGFGNLLNDYDLVEIFAELGVEAGGHPLTLFAHVVENTEADDFETGLAFGAQWRDASAPGQWEASWVYQDLEADAVVATFTDSNFGGG
ncbi:MAG: putative porin, partial [Gammaproteobacteria bacterium]|nr:putative porin [Gammaproteobacteria bacterium]